MRTRGLYSSMWCVRVCRFKTCWLFYTLLLIYSFIFIIFYQPFALICFYLNSLNHLEPFFKSKCPKWWRNQSVIFIFISCADHHQHFLPFRWAFPSIQTFFLVSFAACAEILNQWVDMDVFHVLPDVSGSLKFTQHHNICLEHRERQRPRCCTDWSYGSRLFGLFTGRPSQWMRIKVRICPQVKKF